jgi:predicted nucleic acid-binding protein
LLVVDACVVVHACRARGGFRLLKDGDLHAPVLMWSEARSAICEASWRREITRQDALTMLQRLEDAPVRRRDYAAGGLEAWKIATELGWAKTYDAEYVALAKILGCRLVTTDGRLWRGTKRLGFVVTPEEL